MDSAEKKWIDCPRSSVEYISGVKAFLEYAFSRNSDSSQTRCPCKKCRIQDFHYRDVVFDHLICDGICPNYAEYIYEAARKVQCDNSTPFGDHLEAMLRATFRDAIYQEEGDEGQQKGDRTDAQQFERLFAEGKKPLYPGCTNFSTLSFLVKLYHVKCNYGMTEACFTEIVGILKLAFPHANIPKSFNDAKNTIKALGLDYEKIHACPNDCLLYWGVNKSREVCHICGLSRWKGVKSKGVVRTEVEGVNPRIPCKVMRYFPLKPRLQRMFLCKEFSQLMRWHAEQRCKDGKLRHPADGEAWKAMDAKYPHFSLENRNVRLGLASDGFNPYRTMSSTHSTWPIVLVNYNLPPWLSMRAENLILSTLIPGPTSPGNNIDVYLQPLIAELKDLWDIGIQTHDVKADETFTLRASLLWTISDFPGLAVLSGYSTKGLLACPSCNYEVNSMYLTHSRKICYMGHRRFLPESHKYRFDKKRFDGAAEFGKAPAPLSGAEVEYLLSDFVNEWGQKKRKRNRKDGDDSPWRKKSIFFELPYWKFNLIRHNLDVMHIEKNVFDNIIGTLLDIPGKTKDHLKARKDLQVLGIRKELHPYPAIDTKLPAYPAAIFTMTNAKKDIFCSVLSNVKVPYGYASNISRCVSMKERKLAGYKSHDAHFIMQYLLQICVVKALKPEVAVPLIRLAAFYRGICQKVVVVEDIEKLQHDIAEILCDFEAIYPPSFFDVMVHLQVHLCKEVELGGPVHSRWMFPIEQYLGKLKSYVRNRCKPEASIAEGYLADESLTFCSRFFAGTENLNELYMSQRISCSEGYALGTRRNKHGRKLHLDDNAFHKAHRYILFNSGNKEVEALIEEHQMLIEEQVNSRKYAREKEHSLEFHQWLQEKVNSMENPSSELAALARGPNRTFLRLSGYVIHGNRFLTSERDARCTSQNSGVFYSALTKSFSSSKDENPTVGNVDYYGSIEDIIELDYWGVYGVVLFKCCWYQQEKGLYGLTRVNFNKLCQQNDPYVLASQVQQVFYVEDPTEKGVHYVVKKTEIECHSDHFT